MKKLLFSVFLCFLLSGCTNSFSEIEKEQPSSEVSEHTDLQESKSTDSEPVISETISTESVLSEENSTPQTTNDGNSSSEYLDTQYDFTICFAGDISLDENAITTKNLDSQENGIYGCIDPILISYMQNADLMCLNNEFTYSLQGSPMSGKAYTFRANPERVSVLSDLGVDLVTLANNHVYDYGKTALLDTFSTLSEAGIPYFGAGHNLSEARQPFYVELDGKTVAFVGASRAEKNKMTPQATENAPGILRCYDTELVIESIREAKTNADYVIVFVHWGTEYSDELEEIQITDGHDFIDAGADAVIGAHSHCLQGFEFYQGAPIVYSLGNFWFNSKTLDTMLIELHFSGDSVTDHLDISVIPALQKEGHTSYLEDSSAQRKLYDYLESISHMINIDENGLLIMNVE